MVVNRQSAHYGIFLFALTLMVVGLAVSRFLLSIGGLLLVLNWLLEGGFREKFSRLSQNRVALWLILLFLLHVIWLWNTTNFEYALKDIRIKLPILFLPVVLGSVRPMPVSHYVRLLWLFTLSVILATFMSWGHYLLEFDKHIQDIREIVFYSSSVRISLLILIAGLFVVDQWRKGRVPTVVAGIIALWFLGFLVLLQSVTGLVILFALVLFYIVVKAGSRLSSWKKILAVSTPLILLFMAVAVFWFGFEKYRSVNQTPYNLGPFETHSIQGEEYDHHLDNFEVESGNYIYRYIAIDELSEHWSQRSEMDVMHRDLRGQLLRFTLIRYLAALGLPKDSVGVTQLSDLDIQRIEQGYPSPAASKNPLVRRLDGIYFGMNAYFNGASPQGSSIMQRWVFMQTGWKVAAKNWLTGVGTGDVDDEMQKQYEADQSLLDAEHRRRPHNQYLTFLISFGIIGAIYFLYLNVWILRHSIRKNHFLGMGFALIAMLSFLSEDTLETQVGATFYGFFYSYLLLLKTRENASDERSENQ